MKEEAKVNVTKTTKLNVDGETQYIDVDRSAYYNHEGKKFQILLKNNGYSVLNTNNEEMGVLRKTSNNNYIYRDNEKVSVGYFDTDGNLVLETYDYKKDIITKQVFNIE
jgi:hypothetical protein